MIASRFNPADSSKWLWTGVSLLFLVAALWMANRLIITAEHYVQMRFQLAEEWRYDKRLFDPGEWQVSDQGSETRIDYLQRKVKLVLNYRSAHTTDNTDDNTDANPAAKLQAGIAQQQQDINRLSVQLTLMLTAYLFFALIWHYRRRDERRLPASLIGVSIVCLFAGLFTPMLEIGAVERDLNLGNIPIQKDVMGIALDVTIQKQFDGDMYFYYQSKSIWGLIILLFEQHNYLVGLSILIFSVLLPLLKTLFMLVYLWRPGVAASGRFTGMILNSGKWSMADVFVAAIFLAFLAFSNLQTGITTYSHISAGLYFFLAYCVLSIFTSTLIKPVNQPSC